MIKFTKADADFEKFSLGEDALFALPLSISEGADGSLRTECYALAESDVKKYVYAHEDSLFSEKAREELTEILLRHLSPLGYSAAEETGEVLLEYRMTEAKSQSGTDTVILKTNAEIARYGADTTLWNLELDDEDPFDVICAVIKDSHVVAYAAANDFDGEFCEVNVECAPSHRRGGFGSACAAGFARYILENTDAEGVRYVCRKKNTASVRTAQSAGFELYGKSVNFVFYR